jgi:DNA-binding Xre family transcriptional regulator
VPPAPTLRLRIAELLAERGMTAYQLRQATGDRIPMSTAYEFLKADRVRVRLDQLALVAEALEVTPAELFDYRPGKRRA